MTLSSRRGCSCGLVDSVVAEHGPEYVEASAGQLPGPGCTVAAVRRRVVHDWRCPQDPSFTDVVDGFLKDVGFPVSDVTLSSSPTDIADDINSTLS